MNYRIQRLKEDLTNAQRRNKAQKKANAKLAVAYERKLIEIEDLKKEIDSLNEIISDLESKIEENYRPITREEELS